MPHDRHSLSHLSTGDRQAQRSQWERLSPDYPTFRKWYLLKETASSIHKTPGITLCIRHRCFLASPQWRPRFQHSVWAAPHHWRVPLIPWGQRCKALVSVPMAQLCPPEAAFPYQGNEEHTQNSQFTTSTCIWCLSKHCQNQSKAPQTRKGRKEGRKHQVLTGAESLDHLKPRWTFSADGKDEELHKCHKTP